MIPSIPSIEQGAGLLSEVLDCGLVDRFREGACEPVELGFNPFVLISDVYHRENLHSDVIAALLDPRGAHGCGPRFLSRFLELLRKTLPDMDPDDYGEAEVVRERGRIDILVQGRGGRHIVIENKINHAIDQPEQLLRYGRYVEERANGTVDAYVYLGLHHRSEPDMSAWPEEARSRIRSRLVPLAAVGSDGRNLVEGWVDRCLVDAEDAENHEVVVVLRHYRSMLVHLGVERMDLTLMDRFHELVVASDRYEALQVLMSLHDGLPEYLAKRLAARIDGGRSAIEREHVLDGRSRYCPPGDGSPFHRVDLGVAGDVPYNLCVSVEPDPDDRRRVGFALVVWNRHWGRETDVFLDRFRSALGDAASCAWTAIEGKADNALRFERWFRFPEDEATMERSVAESLRRLCGRS